VPFRTGAIIDGYESRLTPHGQAHVVIFENLFHGIAQIFDLGPLLVAIGLGDARWLLDPRH
jgi:hypothetical protein